MRESRFDKSAYKCDICGSSFRVLDIKQYAYKDKKHHKHFCSWGCLRKWEREQGVLDNPEKMTALIDKYNDIMAKKEEATRIKINLRARKLLK